MKKILFFISAVVLLSSCEDFLDSTSYTTKDSNSFPKTEEDANQMLTGVYSSLNIAVANPQHTYFMLAELVSDDRLGGGGDNDKALQALNSLMYAETSQLDAFWTARYSGISRANSVIEALESMDEGDLKQQKIGEAKFLKAWSYFELVQCFGDVPLMKGVPQSVAEAEITPPQASQEELFTQIGTDVWEAYSNMPSYKWNELPDGTVTKWAAAGLLARVYLFYTGFYGKDVLPTNDGQVTKEQVIAALKDCIDNSGHGLVDDYRSLWAYTNTASRADYPYAAAAPAWVKDGENKEHVFSIKMSHLADWSTTIGYSNQYCLFFGIRSAGKDDQYKNTFPMGQGWGAGPVTSTLWNEWLADEPTDIRRSASIWNYQDEDLGSYYWGGDKQMEETGLWQKKYIATTAYKDASKTDLWNSWTSVVYNHTDNDNFQLAHEVDLVGIRYADILLMHSELSKTADGINQVRARAGLPAVAYTDNALRKERRYELAFEGLRWGDIRRWGIAETVLPEMYNKPIRNNAVVTTMKPQSSGGIAARYQATKGFFMIPQTQVDLSNGAIKQNPGWGTEAAFNQWSE
jgi:hypothetical protein